APFFDLGEPLFADARVEDGFELLALGRIGKDAAGEFIATKLAVGADEIGSKDRRDFHESGLAGFDDSSGQNVRINDRNAAFGEQLSASGFAHADAAGDPDDEHRVYLLEPRFLPEGGEAVTEEESKRAR